MTNLQRIRRITLIVVLAALAIVAGLIQIPWIPIPPVGVFLFLDFSDVIILVSLLTIGFLDTFGVIVLRTVVRRLIFSMAPYEWVGEIPAVIASLLLMLSFYLISLILKEWFKKRSYSFKEILITLVMVVSLQVLIMPVISTLFITPMNVSLRFMDTFHLSAFSFMRDPKQVFFSSWNSYLWFGFVAFVPFNAVKAVVIAMVFYLLKPGVLELKEVLLNKGNADK